MFEANVATINEMYTLHNNLHLWWAVAKKFHKLSFQIHVS
jgi:hypothetical protein